MLPADHLPCSRGCWGTRCCALQPNRFPGKACSAQHDETSHTPHTGMFFVFFVRPVSCCLSFHRFSSSTLRGFLILSQDMHRSTALVVCKQGPSPVEIERGGNKRQRYWSKMARKPAGQDTQNTKSDGVITVVHTSVQKLQRLVGQ